MVKKIGLIAVIAAFVVGFIFRDKLEIFWYASERTANKMPQDFFISSPLSLLQLSKKLQIEGIVETEKAIIALGNYKQLSKQKIALGKYSIEPRTSLRTLLNGFTKNSLGNGNAELEVDVVVPNVRFLEDLAGILSKKTLVDSAEFIALLQNPKTLETYGFTKEELPALFLPNTYKMYFDINSEIFLERMAKEFKNFWNDERKGKLVSIGLRSPSEAVTLASIVYSEQSKQASEWPIIAGLYLNRIRQGMKLQSDPTFKYCWGKKLDTVQRLLEVHRNIQCDYNTYWIQGLPPGPICIPPSSVVNAVLNPDKNDYLFMCAEPSYSGLHNFAKEYSKHSVNARLFQNWLSAELAKKSKNVSYAKKNTF